MNNNLLKIDVPLYYSDVIIIIDPTKLTKKEVRKFCKEHYKEVFEEFVVEDFWNYIQDEDYTQRNGASCYSNGSLHVIMFGNKVPRKATKIIPFITHEFLHATFAILEHKGFTLSRDSDEAYTYLQQYMLEQFLIWAEQTKLY